MLSSELLTRRGGVNETRKVAEILACIVEDFRSYTLDAGVETAALGHGDDESKLPADGAIGRLLRTDVQWRELHHGR